MLLELAFHKLFVTFVTLTRNIDIGILIFFSPYGSPIILVFSASNIFMKFPQGHPLRGTKYKQTTYSMSLWSVARYGICTCNMVFALFIAVLLLTAQLQMLLLHVLRVFCVDDWHSGTHKYARRNGFKFSVNFPFIQGRPKNRSVLG